VICRLDHEGFHPSTLTYWRRCLAGSAVPTVGRVGYGQASRPQGDTLTFGVSAGYVQEVIQAVRIGALGDAVSTVVLLGPWAGADIAIVEPAPTTT
jgi:hypothetical protein